MKRQRTDKALREVLRVLVNATADLRVTYMNVGNREGVKVCNETLAQLREAQGQLAALEKEEAGK